MAEKKKARKGLGKGLDILIPTEPVSDEVKADKLGVQAAQNGEAVQELKMIDIEPNPNQPRKYFEQEKLEDLASSIKQHGLVQPLLVKRQENGRYLIIAGERRWRASKLAGLKKVPCIVKDYSDVEVMEIALIENLQREDLNPIEEAEGYRELISEFNLTQESVSERVGKSRSAVANALRLNNLTDEVKKMVVESKLSQGHARTLLPLTDDEMQISVARRIVKEGLNVRQTETLIANLKKQKSSKPQPKQNKDLLKYYAEAERKLSSSLGTKVKIQEGRKKSKIEIEYYTHDDLERLMREICQ